MTCLTDQLIYEQEGEAGKGGRGGRKVYIVSLSPREAVNAVHLCYPVSAEVDVLVDVRARDFMMVLLKSKTGETSRACASTRSY